MALALGVLLLSGGDAQARPPYRHALKKHYGARLSAALHQCATCHQTRDEVADPAQFDEEYPPHNLFGARLRELGETAESLDLIARLKQVAAEDADADGVANELEILAARQPGRAASTPTPDETTAAIEAQAAWRREAEGYAWEPFQPVVRPSVPAGDSSGASNWVRTPIDAFLIAEHARRGLTPQPVAAPHVLLRRVYLDLIGLPPTREELRAFLADPSPEAYAREVEKLLASPRHGERWGRHWMDIWRYSDWAGWTDGKQIRDSQPHIWRWRDWIIESLNADRPYDQMVQAMLAADELTPTDDGELRATGFLVRNYKMLSRETWLQETVEHTAKAFLGLTLNCARCHDHMYDPIEQAEYYQFRAIFEPHQVRLDRLPGQADTAIDGLARVYDAEPAAETYLFVRGDDRAPDKDQPQRAGVPRILGGQTLQVQPVALSVAARYPGSKPFVREELLAAAETAVTQAQAALDVARQSGDASATPVEIAEAALSTATAQRDALAAKLAADTAKYLEPAAPNATELAGVAARAERQAALAQADEELRRARHAHALLEMQGPTEDQAAQKKLAEAAEKLKAATEKQHAAATAAGEASAEYTPLTAIYPAESTGRRAALARWLTSPENPLVARVAANHVWLRHFGRGLVESTFDFGLNGKPPSHPALLDWLAAELMSPTWQPASSAAPATPWSIKHLHRLIVLSSAYRQASHATDSALALDPDNRWLARMTERRMEAELVRDAVLYVAGQLDLSTGGPDLDYQQGLTTPRRSLYFRHAAEKQMTFLQIFDAAAVTECYERKTSIMPQQALAMANSQLTIAQSRRLARRWQGDAALADPAEFVAAAYEQVLSRSATAAEIETCLRFLEERQQRYAIAAAQVTAAATVEPLPGSAAPDDVVAPATDAALRARENLLHVLLNHHEFVTMR